MFVQRTQLTSLGIFLLILLSLFVSAAIQPPRAVNAQDETDRTIVADDFLKNRPGKPRIKKPRYTLATAATKRSDQPKWNVGVTIWRLEPSTAGSGDVERSAFGNNGNSANWIPRRVEAGVQFQEGDSLRLSIESPRDGYLYVVNRDWLADGSYGETNLIFPTQGEDNRLIGGKLIDIPGQDRDPFRASPKNNQSSELLTIIVTSSPLRLPLSKRPMPISRTQLMEWGERWGAQADRFEMNDGAGQARTKAEELAASPTRARQLTREDPLPQTIYSLVPKNEDGLLFNLVLSYVR
jgi:hypothetical protein